MAVLQLARAYDCPWVRQRVTPLLIRGTWRCCSGRRSTAARGIRVSVKALPCGTLRL
jgi:hypothetical protein